MTTIAAGEYLAPGSSPGTITYETGLTLIARSIFDFELGTASDYPLAFNGSTPQVTAVPEPSTYAVLIGAFALGCAVFPRHRART